MKTDDMFERQLFALTTIIQTKLQVDSVVYSGSASGFYYTEIEEGNDKKGPHWAKIEKQWLITNRLRQTNRSDHSHKNRVGITLNFKLH